MNYTSTRNNTLSVSSAQAITKGISEDGGLFVPTSLPKITPDFIEELLNKSYIDRARQVLSLFLTDFTKEEINFCTEGAYSTGFSCEKVAPVVSLTDTANILELWHGPTCAFKDMALQLLPYLLTKSVKKTAPEQEIVILVATSGDTGKAALEGFKDVDGTKILVFYPNDGVSPMQKLQMTTQEGNNVGVCAIYGNFDDAQTGVKKIFTDETIKAELKKHNLAFSSANSINWGRLVPQIVYYFSAYADMVNNGKIKNGEKVNFTVPTGNFGNILAAYYAMEMGLPVNRLICASNANDVLTEFLTCGRYNRKRDFHTTISPSMDILISSNLERLLFHICKENSDTINSLFTALSQNGEYTVDEQTLDTIKKVFSAGKCDDEKTKATIRKVWKENNYLCDTHTAVAIAVYNDYKEQTGDTTPTVIASTANPYKFSQAVLSAVTNGSYKAEDEFGMVEELQKVTLVKAPVQLAGLKGKQPVFNGICTKEDMTKEVFSLLKI